MPRGLVRELVISNYRCLGSDFEQKTEKSKGNSNNLLKFAEKNSAINSTGHVMLRRHPDKYD